MARYQPKSLPTRELAALAFAAFRTNNNEIVKTEQAFDEASGGFIPVVSNKQYIKNTIAQATDRPVLAVTEADYTAADEAITVVQGDATMKILLGRNMSDFAKNLVELIGKETVSEYDAGLMAYLPMSAQRVRESQDRQEKVATIAFGSKHLGAVGSKIAVDFTVIESRFLQAYNCWSVFGSDTDGNCVRYTTSKKELTESGRIQGKIRELIEDSYRNGAQVTVMNYVKRV